MLFATHSHRYADMILNANYAVKRELEGIVSSLDLAEVGRRFDEANHLRVEEGHNPMMGKQAVMNAMFKDLFKKHGWESERNVFEDPDNDLVIDFSKNEVGVDVAFNQGSFIGGAGLRLQAAGEVEHVISVGVYVCPTKAFAREISRRDGSSMVNFERTQWYLISCPCGYQ